MTELVDDLGSGLRRAREASGRTLREIADATKLSMRSLTALENNRIEQLPGGIYRRAIVRAYASHVGLDPEKTLRAFLRKYPDDVPTWQDLVPPQVPARRRALHTLISAIGALVPMLAAVVYFSMMAGSSDAPHLESERTPSRSEVLQASMMPFAFASTRPADAMAMMISVSALTSLQVIADGREVALGRFAPGEVIRLTLGNDVVLVGDNAGAVHFSINGRAGRTLGDVGQPLTARISRADYQDWLIKPQ